MLISIDTSDRANIYNCKGHLKYSVLNIDNAY